MNDYRKFAKYGTVALGAAITDWIVFVSLVGSNLLDPLFSQMTSRIAGGLFSFASNRYWSFRAKDGNHLVKQGRRFLLLYGFSYCLSISLFYLFSEIFGISAFIAKLVTDSAILVINYIVMNNYVYHGRAGFSHRIIQRIKN